MATKQKTVDFIIDQAKGAGSVSARKMFGGYALYCDGKVVALICDDTLFLKVTANSERLTDGPKYGPPYPGAKPHIIVSEAIIEDDALLGELIGRTAADLPAPKPKPAKKRKVGGR
jgi:DNA transformation protein and related proteins